MNHSSYIFGAMVIGFIVYIIVKNQIGSYLAVIGLGKDSLPAVNPGVAQTENSAILQNLPALSAL